MADDVNALPGGPQGAPREDARTRLWEAAVAAFAARGFHGTTTRDIAGGAGMSPAALYVHHRSKEEVLYAISREGHRTALGLCEQAVASAPDPPAQLSRLVRDFVRHHAEHSTVARIVNYELAALSEEHRAEIDRMRDRMDALVREVVERGCANGSFGTAEPAMTAGAVLSMGIDVSRWYRADAGWTPDAVAAHYCELALRMVGAAGARGSSAS